MANLVKDFSVVMTIVSSRDRARTLGHYVFILGLAAFSAYFAIQTLEYRDDFIYFSTAVTVQVLRNRSGSDKSEETDDSLLEKLEQSMDQPNEGRLESSDDNSKL